MTDVYEDSILLIGPPHIGKGRISTILSEKTNLPLVTLESSRDKYYKELNYDKEYANKLKRESGELARYEYSKPFEAYFVEKFLRGLTESSIVKFEATQSVYEDQTQFNSIYNIIKDFKNVILLLPDIDMLGSWKIINKLSKVPSDSDLSKLNWHLVSSSCNTSLATDIIYTCGKNVEEVTEEILNIVKNKKQKESAKAI